MRYVHIKQLLVHTVILFSFFGLNAESLEKKLEKMIVKLKPLHKKMGKVQPGDWLTIRKEPGQTFRQYLRSSPVIPDKYKKVIYIQPIGTFTKDQRKIVKKTAKFLYAFYNLPVIVEKDIPLSKIPQKARRTHWGGQEQLLTTYILHDLLKPRLQDNAMMVLGMTASDLWPGRDWNFVFGQASLRERVGVWSIYRNGNPSGGKDEFRKCLLRTIKTATHEAGHMFSMRHCTAYECGMCGSNSREESDRRPMAFCPECLAKLLWATKTNPVKRFKKLIEICKKNGLDKQRIFYEKSLALIEKTKENNK